MIRLKSNILISTAITRLNVYKKRMTSVTMVECSIFPKCLPSYADLVGRFHDSPLLHSSFITILQRKFWACWPLLAHNRFKSCTSSITTFWTGISQRFCTLDHIHLYICLKTKRNKGAIDRSVKRRMHLPSINLVGKLRVDQVSTKRLAYAVDVSDAAQFEKLQLVHRPSLAPIHTGLNLILFATNYSIL